MSIVSILSFALALFLLAVTPGPGVFTVLGRTLKSGFRKSVFVTAGIVTGDLIYLCFAMSGLSWLAQNMGDIFVYVRILGGIYLIYLGVKNFFAKVNLSADGDACDDNRSRTACYGEGLVITLSNPKVIIFYCSLLPAFIDLGSLNVSGAVSIIIVDAVILGLVMTGYSFLALQTGRIFRGERGIKLLNRSSGLLMAAAGSVMIVKR